MSTLSELVERNEITKIDANLDCDALETRCVYALPQAIEKLELTLPRLNSIWDTSFTPVEQLDALLSQFCGGEELPFGYRFKCLNPISSGIWELKTPDLRLFGWFYKKDIFILSNFHRAEETKVYNLYHGFINEAVSMRDSLNLDPPKSIEGDCPYDVVSNYFTC